METQSHADKAVQAEIGNYSTIIADLRTRRAGHEAEIVRIDDVLAALEFNSPDRRFPAFKPALTPKGKARVKRGPRVKIATAILETITTAGRPMITKDILRAVIKAGVKFNTHYPINGVQSALYKLKKDGKIENPAESMWSPLGYAAPVAQAA